MRKVAVIMGSVSDDALAEKLAAKRAADTAKVLEKNKEIEEAYNG